MSIEWHLPGSTPEQLERARAAALAVFKANRIQPEVAAVARLEMQAWAARGRRGPLPHHESPKGAAIFHEAQVAAQKVADTDGIPAVDIAKGYIHVQIEAGSKGAIFMRESDTLNWIDPEDGSHPRVDHAARARGPT